MADDQSVTGAQATDSPSVPDFASYARTADDRDLGRTSPVDDTAPAPDSPPVQPGIQAPSTDGSTADSASAKPDAKAPKNVQTRNAELEREIADLNRRLEIRRGLREELSRFERVDPGVKPAASPAAQPPDEWTRYRTHPKAPNPENFNTYEDFVAAQAVFVADQRYEERQTRDRLDAESRERVGAVQHTIAGFHERLKTARAADAGYDSRVSPDLIQVTPAFALGPGDPIQPANAIAQAIVESDVATDLLVHFSTVEGQREWRELVKYATPAAMLRAFGRIEARFAREGSADAPPVKTVSSAPVPPVTLGVRQPQSADRVGAAVKAGDYLAYEAAQNAADLARRK